jgi:hypothetical protein
MSSKKAQLAMAKELDGQLSLNIDSPVYGDGDEGVDLLDQAKEMGLVTPLPSIKKGGEGKGGGKYKVETPGKDVTTPIEQLEREVAEMGLTMDEQMEEIVGREEEGGSGRRGNYGESLTTKLPPVGNKVGMNAGVVPAGSPTIVLGEGRTQRRRSFGGRRGSFSKFVGGLFGLGDVAEEDATSSSPDKKEVAGKGGGKRRKSWGEIFMGERAEQLAEAPKRRQIVVPEKKRAPSLKEIKEKEKKEAKKGRGFRNR